MKTAHFAICLLSLGVFSLGDHAQAALIATDEFDYTPGSSLNGANGGTGWSTAWGATANFTIGSSSLSFGSLATSGGNVLGGTGSVGQIPVRTFPSVSSGSLYVSMLFNVVTSLNGYFGFRLNGSLAGIYEGTQTGNNLLIRRTSGSPLVQSSVTPATNSTYLIVMKIDFDANGSNDAFSLFVNPTPGATEPSPSAMITGTDPSAFDIGSVGNFQLYQDANISAASFDEVRIGTTWLDVVPVPEPSQSGLVLTGALSLFALNRWRARKAI